MPAPPYPPPQPPFMWRKSKTNKKNKQRIKEDKQYKYSIRWVCDHCDSVNNKDDQQCFSCGAPRKKSQDL
jgi:rubrerythrin